MESNGVTQAAQIEFFFKELRDNSHGSIQKVVLFDLRKLRKNPVSSEKPSDSDKCTKTRFTLKHYQSMGFLAAMMM
jgi:hypothetical protein